MPNKTSRCGHSSNITSLNNSELYAIQQSVEHRKTASAAVAKWCVIRQRLASGNSVGWRFRFLFHGRLQLATSQLNRLTISPMIPAAAELSMDRIDRMRLMKTSGTAAWNSSSLIRHFRFNKRGRSNVVYNRTSFILAAWCIMNVIFRIIIQNISRY